MLRKYHEIVERAVGRIPLFDCGFYIIGGLIQYVRLTSGITTSEAICARAKFNMTAETINLRDRPAAWLPDETLALSYSTYRPT